MLLHVPNVLSKPEVSDFRCLLDAAHWADGRATTGVQGAQVKHNLQLAADNPVALKLGARILKALLIKHPLFVFAALPLRMLEPMFNRYEGGGHYGLHVDGAVMHQRGSVHPLRSDVSLTLFPD